MNRVTKIAIAFALSLVITGLLFFLTSIFGPVVIAMLICALGIVPFVYVLVDEYLG